MALSDITQKQVNLPLVGGITIAGLAIGIGIIYLITRRKKSISLRL